jgi:hypothetical protein
MKLLIFLLPTVPKYTGLLYHRCPLFSLICTSLMSLHFQIMWIILCISQPSQFGPNHFFCTSVLVSKIFLANLVWCILTACPNHILILILLNCQVVAEQESVSTAEITCRTSKNCRLTMLNLKGCVGTEARACLRAQIRHLRKELREKTKILGH